MYRAYASRGNRDNQYDNKEVIRKMVTLRLEKAQLLGYPTYAEAQSACKRLRTNAKYRDAFVVAMQGTQRISLQEASRLTSTIR